MMEQIFCKHTKDGMEMIELVAIIDRKPELEEPLEIIKNVLVSEDGKTTLVCLRR